MQGLTDLLTALTALAGLAAGLVKLAREVDGWAKRRKKKGRHFKNDGPTS